MSSSRLIVYKTQLANVDVITTNNIGGHILRGQYVVCDMDNEARQILEIYGPFPTFEEADDRALLSVTELNIIASATIPDESGF